MKAAIVVPTVRPGNMPQFFAAWKDEFSGHEVIVIEDNPTRTLNLSSAEIAHYSWEEIDQEFGEDSWIIPRRTDCIRSFGFYKASQRKVDLIVSLDDDCYPVERGFISKHWQRLTEVADSPAWTSTVLGGTPRGLPYFEKARTAECVLNHGLWTNIPDYDAITQIYRARQPFQISPLQKVIPRGRYFPMCGMNLAFKPVIAPIMYFLLMGRDWPYDRFGDIWCGIIAKRICDHLGYAVCSGDPVIDHQRASNVWQNLRKEVPGYEINEVLWKRVDSVILTATDVRDCYREIADQFPALGEYWSKLRVAIGKWLDLFDFKTLRQCDRVDEIPVRLAS